MFKKRKKQGLENETFAVFGFFFPNFLSNLSEFRFPSLRPPLAASVTLLKIINKLSCVNDRCSGSPPSLVKTRRVYRYFYYSP